MNDLIPDEPVLPSRGDIRIRDYENPSDEQVTYYVGLARSAAVIDGWQVSEVNITSFDMQVIMERV